MRARSTAWRRRSPFAILCKTLRWCGVGPVSALATRTLPCSGQRRLPCGRHAVPWTCRRGSKRASLTRLQIERPWETPTRGRLRNRERQIQKWRASMGTLRRAGGPRKGGSPRALGCLAASASISLPKRVTCTAMPASRPKRLRSASASKSAASARRHRLYDLGLRRAQGRFRSRDQGPDGRGWMMQPMAPLIATAPSASDGYFEIVGVWPGSCR
jgi:hypothetical protein